MVYDFHKDNNVDYSYTDYSVNRTYSAVSKVASHYLNVNTVAS